MTPLPDDPPPRSPTTFVVGCVLVLLLVAGALAFSRATRPCGSGVGDPADAVAGVLVALQEHDDRALCLRIGDDYRIPEDEAAVLRERVDAAGGISGISVAEVGEQQMGNLHVLVATARDGQLVGRFQTTPGQHGALVAVATSSASSW